MIEQYSKAAAALCGKTANVKAPVLVITSSTDKVDVLETTTQTAVATTALNKKVAVVNACLNGANGATVGEPSQKGSLFVYTFVADNKEEAIINDQTIKGFLNDLKETYDMILVATDPICDAKSTLLFAAQSNGVILAEKRKDSRTDEIDQAVSSIQTVGADPLGFILL